MDSKQTNLADIMLKIGSGATPRGGDASYKISGISLIRSQNVYDFRFTSNGLAFIDEVQARKLANVVVQTNDLLLNITGDSIGRCCIVPNEILPARVNQHVAIIRVAPDKADPRYLLYYLNESGRKQSLLNQGHGGTRQALTKGIIENFPIDLPPLPIQRRIGEILGRLDDKIGVNRRINATLEAMAQALYKHWFVDFGPFQGGNFVESELGLIPEGWEVIPLGQAIELVKGKSYKSSELQPSRTALVTLKSFRRGGGYNANGLKDYVGKYKQTQVVEPGEVIVACTDITQNADVVGRAALAEASPTYETLVASLDVAIVRPRNQELTREFLFFGLNDNRYTDHIVNYANGSTVLHLNTSGLLEYRFLLPHRRVITDFSSRVRKMTEQIFNANKENFALVATRDYLLPKLLSGEISVEVAEEEVSQAGA